ncbi:MAG: DUF1385 domain-containing protein [Firmicutes bacterium]|jgi:uncharacterized protein YqhQ|nr:DUF1385 domain-containing protein [Bacillota bacterium]
MGQRFSYGGQAVIEGVMMRGRNNLAVAVRRSDGIILHEEKLRPWAQRYPILGVPFIRGSAALIESLVMGVRALSFSASQFAEEEEAELTTKDLIMTIGFAVLLTVGLFIALPAYLVRLVQANISSNVLLNIVEGLIKIGLFLLYILGISAMEDIRRVFEYHGAEHKAINCYEAGEPLTVENVAKYTTVHRRCGTNFLLIVFFTSIFVFSFFGRPPFLQRVLLHVALLPIVAGIAYELIRLAGRPNRPWWVEVITAPGLLLQKLTTREPDAEQIEVAIKALQVVVDKDQAKQGTALGSPGHVVH